MDNEVENLSNHCGPDLAVLDSWNSTHRSVSRRMLPQTRITDGEGLGQAKIRTVLLHS